MPTSPHHNALTCPVWPAELGYGPLAMSGSRWRPRAGARLMRLEAEAVGVWLAGLHVLGEAWLALIVVGAW